MTNKKVGISSIGIHVPSLYVSMKSLSELRHTDEMKLTDGLGCNNMAITRDEDDIVDLATIAAQRALSRWDGDINDIGIIAVGTETGLDMSRPLSAWIAEKLNLQGAVRSYEVKHACYGGTLALRQSVEWKLANITSQKKAALVIAADISLYAPNEPAEPTQGAGAIAMIIDEPKIAVIDNDSYPYSKPVFDFWRPVGNPHPQVQGALSLRCYQDAALACFQGLINNQDPEAVFKQYKAICFHTPFPKMVKKAFYNVCKSFGWEDSRIEEIFNEKINPTMQWNRETGNNYTASLWLAVSKTLIGMQSGERIIAFSYGSGCGAELLTLEAGPDAEQGAWAVDMKTDLETRKAVNAETYDEIRKEYHGHKI